MTVSKKGVYLVVMALGGVALLVDRVFLSQSATTPRLAQAKPRRPSHRSADPPSPAAVPGAAPASLDHSIPELPFPRNLPHWDAQTDLRDLFSPMSSDNHRGSVVRGAQRGKGASQDFAKTHKLEAVLVQERLRIAVVNGVSVKVGDSVGGCELVTIDGRNVRFRCRDGEVALTLSPADDASNR